MNFSVKRIFKTATLRSLDSLRPGLVAGLVVAICVLHSGLCAQAVPDLETKEKKPHPATGVRLGKKPSEGWPVFRGNAGSTGVARTTLPEKLEVLWEFKVPQGGFEGSPIIVPDPDGDGKTVYIGDMDGTVFALDLETGKKKWGTHVGFGISASPAFRDGRIFIGDIDGIFHCLDHDGNPLWKFETEGEISSSANFFKGHVLFGSQDSRFYLLNAKTGKAIWQHETPDQIRCSTTVAGGRAFVAGCDGFLHIIDLESGKEAGQIDIKSPTQTTPAVLGKRVFFGTEDSEFFAANWESIGTEWMFAEPDGPPPVRGSAAVTPENLIFGSRNRQVYSLDPQTGDQRWTVTLKAKIDASPVIVGKRVFVGSTDGRLYALSLKDGKTVWQHQFQGGFISSPAVAFERLVVATDRGVVYCLGTKTK